MDQINKKTVVLMVAATPPPYNGMTRVTEIILNSINKNNFELKLLDIADRRSVGNAGKFDFTNVILAFKHFFEFLSLLFSSKPDIIYLPIAQNFLGYIRDSLFLIPARLLSKKVIVHLHGGYFDQFYDKSSPLMKNLIKFTLKDVCYAIVLGESLKKLFKNIIPNEKICVVPNGVEDNFSNFKRFYNKENINILFLSNLIKEKGFFTILNIIPDITKQFNNVKFSFVGDWFDKGDKESTQKFVEKNNISEKVKFYGVLKGPDKDNVLRESDIFAMPTVYKFEGQPLVILEAMSASLPVISTNRAAIPDMVKDNVTGFIIQPDKDSLIRKISELIENKVLREKMGINARQNYLKYYTDETFVATLEKVLSFKD